MSYMKECRITIKQLKIIFKNFNLDFQYVSPRVPTQSQLHFMYHTSTRIIPQRLGWNSRANM